jgi:hypothetical protein
MYCLGLKRRIVMDPWVFQQLWVLKLCSMFHSFKNTSNFATLMYLVIAAMAAGCTEKMSQSQAVRR